MGGRVRRLIAALARTANWRCPNCDTWNSDNDMSCMCCGS